MPNDTSSGATGPLVVVLAYDGLCTFEFGVAYEVFGLARPEMGDGWYRFAVCGVDPGPIRAGGGLTVSVDRGLEAIDEADLVVVPGWRGVDESVPAPLIDGLVAAHRRGARLMSLCSGVVVLAATGLLSGRRATTHWRYLAALGARHPDIEFGGSVLYIDEGPLLTAAGSAAGIDLCLHVVRKDFGTAAANSVARRLVVPPHREGGQAQFIETPLLPPRESARFGPLLQWMRANLDQAQSVHLLASRAGMSVRTFQRRFEATTGMSPGEWMMSARLARARGLLETEGGRSLDDVAAASGFGSLAAMRHHFRSRLGTTPSAYRQRFAS